jgi:Kef-type K+ transport system membrane component KefB
VENLIFLAHVVLLIVLSPIISRIFRLPTPVVEILLGSFAVWAGFLHTDNDVFKNLAKIGFFYLMFLAGLEIDISRLLHYKERFLKKTILYFLSLYGFSFLLFVIFKLPLVYIVALPIISLGMVMALINQYGKEEQWLEFSLIIGAFGELLSIASFVIFDGAMTHGLGWYFAKNILMLIAVFVSSYVLFRLLRILFWWYPQLKSLIMPHDDSHQQSLRISIALFFVLLAMMQWLDIDMVLGAFIAGIFISNFFGHKTELPHQLSTFGFGFLIPLFFIFVGTTLNLDLVLTTRILSHALWIVLAMVLVRMLSSFIAYYRSLKFKNTVLFSLSSSMPLTFLVAVATIAAKKGAIHADEYASFIVAALIEGIVIMIVIQLLIFIFKRHEQRHQDSLS